MSGQPRLTHVDATGAARMVDVGAKDVSVRTATARGRLLVAPSVVALLRGEGVPKGDALGVARVAGILGAKRVPDLVPLCHPIGLSGVVVELTVVDDAVEITAVTRTRDRTGVEMEALTAVAVAGLTLHDMVKAVDPAAVLTDVRVVEKTGGASGDWTRPDAAPGSTTPLPAVGDDPAPEPCPGLPPDARAVVVTVSDRSHSGSRPDRSGPLLAGLLGDLGFTVASVVVVPDAVDAIGDALRAAVTGSTDLVVTTGGTGFAPRDLTPEATRGVIERDAPGLVETLRAADRERVPTAILSRGLAGLRGGTIIVNLPGSPGGVRDGVRVLAPVIGHAVAQLRGGGEHADQPWLADQPV